MEGCICRLHVGPNAGEMLPQKKNRGLRTSSTFPWRTSQPHFSQVFFATDLSVRYQGLTHKSTEGCIPLGTYVVLRLVLPEGVPTLLGAGSRESGASAIA